jgi:hypothetical protein
MTPPPLQYFTKDHAVSMTLRDYFAAKAMQGFLTGEYNLYPHEVVQRAYEIADAMMEARKA